MTDLSSSLQVILQEAGYSTWLAPAEPSPAVCFEDDAIIGFAGFFPDTATLLERWRDFEISCLRRFAPGLRAAEGKAWNVYSLLLTAGPADEYQRSALAQLEENLDQTRKIAASGLASREDIVRAVLPVLPLQYQPRLDRENLTERLRNRIATIAPAVVKTALDDRVPPADVIALLGAEK